LATKVTAKDGDTLCSIATSNGFPDCQKLRSEADNKDFLDRPLKAGDSVTVPEKKEKEEKKGTGSVHKFKRKGVPLPTIRIVHGSPDMPYQSDQTLDHLDISNFRTDQAGVDGTKAFPSGYGFSADGHADLDAFKVEVEDRSASGTVKVLLEAMKPIYDGSGAVAGHEAFTGSEFSDRSLEIECKPVSSRLHHVFRSTYVRLVADEEDKKTLPDQTLLVTDMADGKNADNDKVEILDQRVRASVALHTCKASSGRKCAALFILSVGEDQQYIKLAIHAFRTKAGSKSIVAGLDEQMLRRRTMKWFRRAYAQANLAPKLVEPFVEFIDPPPPDMIVICQDNGRTAAGSSKLSFRLGDPPSTGIRVILSVFRRLTDPTVSIDVSANMTPEQVGQAIAGAMPSDYNATVHLNARAFNAVNGSCDVLVKKGDGSRVFIYGEATTDTRLTITVARVDINKVASNDGAGAMIPSTIDFRRILRCVDPDDGKLDCFIVGAFDRNGLRGRAFVAAADLAGAFQPPAPLRWAAIMGTTSSSGAVMDGSDNLPFTFPHEAGHVLCDAFHTRNDDPNGPTELMSGTGTSQANAVDATKRICGGPYDVDYAMFDPAQTNPGDAIFDGTNAVKRFHDRGSSVLESW